MNSCVSKSLVTLLVLGLHAYPAWAAPRVPKDDREVLEYLPLRNDPLLIEIRALQRELAARPGDAALAARVARELFQLALAQGDPRYVGYAEAALRPWRAAAEAPADILFLRGLLRQYRHDFAGALQDLGAALQRDPEHAEARGWRAAIYMVQADYAAAARECAALPPSAGALMAAGCTAYVEAATGQARKAYERLSSALQAAPDAGPNARLWAHTRLAEMAWRLGDHAQAERHFRAALAAGRTDNFLLAAYADYLLERGRAQEVVRLLESWERSETLLLRLAIAGRTLKLPAAERQARILGERFADAGLRGERLHLQEEARYLLDLKRDNAAALGAATENYKAQREPRDAALLMEAALAARQPGAAAPALAWLDSSGFESERLRSLAAQLKALK